MEITLDTSRLTAADVDLIEDTLNDQLGRYLGDEIVGFTDVFAVAQWLGDARDAEKDEKPEPARPTSVSPRVFNVLRKKSLTFTRALELAQMRRDNPKATWDETGRDPLFRAEALDPPSGPPVPAPIADGDE